MRWWEVLQREKVLSAVGIMRRSDFVYSKFKIYNGDQDENGSVAMKTIFIDGKSFYWVVHENCYLMGVK